MAALFLQTLRSSASRAEIQYSPTPSAFMPGMFATAMLYSVHRPMSTLSTPTPLRAISLRLSAMRGMDVSPKISLAAST